jgi:hypothetical protein
MILVTSGNDELIGNCLLTVLSSGSTIHSIALGSFVVQKLEELSHLSGKKNSTKLSLMAFPLTLNIQSTSMKLSYMASLKKIEKCTNHS